MESCVASINDKYLFSLSQLSTALGPARETIQKKITNAGILAAGERRGHPVYHVGEVARAVFFQDPFLDIKDPDVLPPKERMEWYKGDNEKDKRDQNRQFLCHVQDVRNEWSTILQRIGSSLDVVTDKLERLCGLTPEQLDLVERTLDDIRNDLADSLEAD